MRIAIGADHGGYLLKELLVKSLNRLGHEVLDVGTSSSEATDYPKFARAVAEAVAGGRCERGIMIDGAGIGSAMVANKVPGVRAALAYDLSSARNSREHNDANLLTLGAGLIGPRLAEEIVSLWLETQCTEERHRRRVAMIEGGPTDSATAAPAGPSAAAATTEASSGSLGNLSPADLDRIARELRRMIGPSGPTGPLAAESPESARRLLTLGARRIGNRPGSVASRTTSPGTSITRSCGRTPPRTTSASSVRRRVNTASPPSASIRSGPAWWPASSAAPASRPARSSASLSARPIPRQRRSKRAARFGTGRGRSTW